MTADRATSVFNFTLVVPSNIAKHFRHCFVHIFPTHSHSLTLAVLGTFFCATTEKHFVCYIHGSLNRPHHAHKHKHVHTIRITWLHRIKHFPFMCPFLAFSAFVLHSVNYGLQRLLVMRRSDLMKHDDGNGHIIDGVSFTKTL